MGLEIVYSDIESVLKEYAEGLHFEVCGYLDDLVSNNYTERNVLGIMESSDSRFDGLRDEIANKLTSDMSKAIEQFNAQIKAMLNEAEIRFKNRVGGVK